MIIYFISALLIAAVVFMLGQYSMLISLMFTAGKVSVVLAVLAALILLYRWYRGAKRSIKLIGRS